MDVTTIRELKALREDINSFIGKDDYIYCMYRGSKFYLIRGTGTRKEKFIFSSDGGDGLTGYHCTEQEAIFDTLSCGELICNGEIITRQNYDQFLPCKFYEFKSA